MRRIVIYAVPVLLLTSGSARPADPAPTRAVVSAERAVLWRALPVEAGGLSNRAAMLLRGDVCTTADAAAATPRWTCTIAGHPVSGYADRGLFGAAGGARPKVDRDALLNGLHAQAAAETDVARRGALLFEAQLLAFRLSVAECPAGDCRPEVIETRLNLHRTATLVDAAARPSAAPRPGPVSCAEGASAHRCLTATLGSDWLTTNNHLRKDRLAFVSAKKGEGDAIQFVVGEGLTDERGRLRQLVILSEQRVEDPLLASLRPNPSDQIRTGPREPLEPKNYLLFAADSTLEASRPLEEPLTVVCADSIVRVERPKAAGLGVTEVEWGDGGVTVAYRYALPCPAALVLDGAIAGIHLGSYTQTPLPAAVDGQRTAVAGAVTLREQAGGDCTLKTTGAVLEVGHRTCEARFLGDLNADGRADAVFTWSGEMGCGAHQLFLSGPTGWQAVATAGWYC